MTPRPLQGNGAENAPRNQPQRQIPQQQNRGNQLVRPHPPFIHRNFQPNMEDAEEQRGAGDGQQPQQPQQRQYPAIEDEAEWLRRYGLNGEPHYGAESYTNQQEAKQRVQAQAEYQAQIHAKLFDGLSPAEQQREAQLKKWSDQNVQIVTSSGSPILCGLRHLATCCDTVFAMAESRPHFESVDESSPLLLSLSDHSREAVLHFLELIREPSVHRKSEDGEAIKPDEQHIIECCQIANYLQCNRLLDDTLVPLLIQSVDSANCLSLCQLADQLSIPALLEASVNHMMRSLGCMEEHEVWGDLTPELQSRIQAIQQILQSSNRRQLFFSSFEEYLALFAEQVEYYRERLEDAVHQQSLHPKQSRGWEYAQSKIDQQQERVRILKLVLQEQKRIFRRQPSS